MGDGFTKLWLKAKGAYSALKDKAENKIAQMAVEEAFNAAMDNGVSPTDAVLQLTKDPAGFLKMYGKSAAKDVATSPVRVAKEGVIRPAAQFMQGAGEYGPGKDVRATVERLRLLSNPEELKSLGVQAPPPDADTSDPRVRKQIEDFDRALSLRVDQNLKANSAVVSGAVDRGLTWGGRLDQPVTRVGRVTDVAGESVLAALEGGNVASAAGRGKQALRMAAYYGLKDAGIAAKEAEDMGLTGWKQKAYIHTRAASAALPAMFAPTEMFEKFTQGVAQKLGVSNQTAQTMIKKTIANTADAELATLFQNAAGRVSGQKSDILDQSQFLENLINQFAIKAASQAKQTTGPRFQGIEGQGRLAAQRGQYVEPTAFERRMFASEEGAKADMLQAMQAHKLLSERYSPQVSEELYHYLDAKKAAASGATVPIPTLSPEATKALRDPLFVDLQAKAAESVNLKRQAEGNPDMVSPADYIHRIKTEGPESTGLGGGAPGLKQAAAGAKGRTVMAFQDHEGGRTVVYSNDRQSKLIDPNTGEVIANRTTLGQALAPEVKESLELGKKLLERSNDNAASSFENMSKQVDEQGARVEKLKTAVDEAEAANSENYNEVKANYDAEVRRYNDLLETADGYRQYLQKRFMKDTGAQSLADPDSRDMFNRLAELNDKIDYTRKNLGVDTDPNWRKKSVHVNTSGEIGVPTEATTHEIEAATPIRYTRDAFGNTALNFAETRHASRNVQLLQELRNTPLAQPDPGGMQAPDGFLRLDDRKYPMFKGYVVDERVAKALQNQEGRMTEPDFMDKINSLYVNLGMANPNVHTKNPVTHFLESVGVKGWLTDTPGIVGDLDRAAEIVNSIKEGKPNRDAINLMQSGVKFMSAGDVKGDYRKFAAGIGGVSHQIPEGFDTSRGQTGVAPIDAAANLSSEVNRNSVWTMDDVFRTALVLRNQRQGMTLPDAVTEARKGYAFYQRFANPLEGGNQSGLTLGANRVMDWMSNSPIAKKLGVFQGYGQDANKILLGKMAGLTDPTDTEFKGPLKVLSTAAAGAGLKAALTPVAQGLANREDIAFDPGGTYHRAKNLIGGLFNTATGDWQEGVKDLSSFFPFAPAPATAINAAQGALRGTLENAGDLADAQQGAKLIAKGNTETGVPLLTRGGSQILKQGASTILGPLSMTYDPYAQAFGGRTDPGEFAARTLLTAKRDRTPAEELMMKLLVQKHQAAPLGGIANENADEVQQFRQAVRAGDQEAVNNLIPQVGIKTAIKQLSNPADDRLTTLANQAMAFRTSNPEDQANFARIIEVASPEERDAMARQGIKVLHGALAIKPENVDVQAQNIDRLTNPEGDQIPTRAPRDYSKQAAPRPPRDYSQPAPEAQPETPRPPRDYSNQQ